MALPGIEVGYTSPAGVTMTEAEMSSYQDALRRRAQRQAAMAPALGPDAPEPRGAPRAPASRGLLGKMAPSGIGFSALRSIPNLGALSVGANEIYKGATGSYTPTEEYAQNLGLSPDAGGSLLSDIAIRTGGVANDALLGVPGYLARRITGRELPRELPIDAVTQAAPVVSQVDPWEPLPGLGGAPLESPLAEVAPAPQVVPQAAPQRAVARQSPALAPESAGIPEPAPEQRLMQAAEVFGIEELQREGDRIESLMQAYINRTGQQVPQELSKMDKFQILAKGLGVAALVAAFPGLGLAAGLGAGLFAGADETGRRQSALAQGAQQARENADAEFGNLMEMMSAGRQNIGNMIGVQERASERAQKASEFDREFAEDARQFGVTSGLARQKLGVLAQQARAQGSQLVPDAETGEYVFLRRDGTTQRTGVMAPPPELQAGRGALAGANYNPLDQVLAIADNLDSTIPYEQRLEMAGRQASGIAQQFNRGIPGAPQVAPQSSGYAFPTTENLLQKYLSQ